MDFIVSSRVNHLTNLTPKAIIIGYFRNFMERQKRKEALTNYSFRDVTLKPAEALESLTQRTRAVFVSNVNAVIANIMVQPSENSILINKLEVVRNRSVNPGGFSISESELQFLYRTLGALTFKDVTKKFIDEIFPTFLKKDDSSTNPGNVCIGYLLDMLRIIDPKVASFDDGVAIIAQNIRESKSSFSFFVLGVMVDDSMHLRGTGSLPFDPFADKEGAKQLKESLLQFVDGGERQDFEKGLSVTIGEMSNAINVRKYGFSLN